MKFRSSAIVFLIVVAAVVLQTTLFGTIRVITPDLVLLVSILFALTRIKPELILAITFSAGLMVDLIGSSLLGLRAIVFTSAAYIAIRTRERADIGRIATALWAGALTLIGVLLLVLLGTLFGQSTLLGEHVFSRLITIPLANMVLAFLIAPILVRVVDQDPAALRY
ncbi:MAG: rod shape-determining protein MreD [Acidimicrobiia bacterium]